MNQNDMLLGEHPEHVQNPPPPLPGAQGQPVLYLPNLLFTADNALEERDCPLITPGPEFPTFPFLRTPGLLPSQVERPNLTLALHPLNASRHRTTPKSHTKTASAIHGLDTSQQTKLTTVLACRTFWENMFTYASHVETPGRLNTWGLPVERRIPFPPATVQARGVKALATWYMSHFSREDIIEGMTSEPSVQGEAIVQIMQPLAQLLKTRYRPFDNGFPQWGRPNSKLHRNNRRDNAGYPDFLLRCSDTVDNHAAIAEVKTWWTYSEALFRNLFEDVDRVSGEFVWRSKSDAAKLIRQVWGELFFFRSRLGFVSNGQRVILFVKPDANTLIVSLVRNWNDPTVLQALAGLTFAGIDLKYVDGDVLIDHLCPVLDQQPNWPPLPPLPDLPLLPIPLWA